MIYFITGASGVGKTTLLSLLKTKYNAHSALYFHFDSIGVPSIDIMIKKYGGPEGWQEAKTYEWISRLLQEDLTKTIFMEGQVDIKFIVGGFDKHHYKGFNIVLLDCTDEEMASRLIHQRNQPELVNEGMFNWLRYLRTQAASQQIPVINTSTLSEEEVLFQFEQLIMAQQ